MAARGAASRNPNDWTELGTLEAKPSMKSNYLNMDKLPPLWTLSACADGAHQFMAVRRLKAAPSKDQWPWRLQRSSPVVDDSAFAVLPPPP